MHVDTWTLPRRPARFSRPPCVTGQGFTLIEVLVALTLVATIALIGWRGLEWVSQRRASLDQDDAHLQQVLRLLGQFEADLRAMAPSSTLSAAARPVLPATMQVKVASNSPDLELSWLRTDAAGGAQWRIVRWRLGNGVWRGMTSYAPNWSLAPISMTQLAMAPSTATLSYFVEDQGWTGPQALRGTRPISALSLRLVLEGRTYTRTVALP